MRSLSSLLMCFMTHRVRTIYGSLPPSETLPEEMPRNFLIVHEAFESVTACKGGCVFISSPEQFVLPTELDIWVLCITFLLFSFFFYLNFTPKINVFFCFFTFISTFYSWLTFFFPDSDISFCKFMWLDYAANCLLKHQSRCSCEDILFLDPINLYIRRVLVELISLQNVGGPLSIKSEDWWTLFFKKNVLPDCLKFCLFFPL